MFVAGRAYEQIRNSVAYPNLNVKIGATHGGVLIGEDGASHQCIEDISLMRTISNMTCLIPCDKIATYKFTEVGKGRCTLDLEDLPLQVFMTNLLTGTLRLAKETS
jgi:transketolase C-terminal domain/subunit